MHVCHKIPLQMLVLSKRLYINFKYLCKYEIGEGVNPKNMIKNIQ